MSAQDYTQLTLFPEGSPASRFPTPTAMDANPRLEYHPRKDATPTRSSTLSQRIHMFPTPTTRDHKDGTAQACANVPVNGLLGRAVHMYPTPRANDAVKRGQISNDPRNGLPAAVLWKTPTAGDSADRAFAVNSRGESQLSAQVKLYPTPNTSNANEIGEHGDGGKNLQTEVGGQLNPEWVCALMGFPPGWAVLED